MGHPVHAFERMKAADLVKRLSSLTDLLDLFSKYLMAFFTICARRGFEEETDEEAPAAEDEPSPAAESAPPPPAADEAPSEVCAGGLSVCKGFHRRIWFNYLSA